MRALRPLLGDPRQFASARRIALDDGGERGVGAVAFSTGGGLDFWVLTDRSFDIGPLWFRGMPIAWQGPAGFRHPSLHNPESDDGRGFGRSFSGLVVTCGLDHIRQPGGGHPLHGRFPYTPGRLLAYGEDWDVPEPILFCDGEMVQARNGGEAFRLRRRITAPIGGRGLRITDRLDCLGPEPAPHALLYHVNFGAPAIATGTVISAGSERMAGPFRLPDPLLSRDATCRPAPPSGTCVIRTPNPEGEDLTITLGFSPQTLPWLQLWHDLRPGVCVLSLEPCTSDRLPDGQSAAPILLSPGDARTYTLSFDFTT